MWIFILVAVIAVLLILYIKFYNRLRRLSVKVQEGSAGIDVAWRNATICCQKKLKQ